MAAKTQTIVEAPAGLSERSRALWHAHVPARAATPGRQALLEQALRSLDRADEARQAIAGEGMTTRTESTGALHVHPLTKIELQHRQLFSRLWIQLGFDWHRGVD